MNNEYSHCNYKLWKIYCSFCIAIFLQKILCFPKIWNVCPSWVMIFLVYWIITSSYQINIGTGFILGLILDIISGSVLGVHALSLSTLVYLIIRRIYFFKYISIWLQSFFIVIFSFMNHSFIVLLMTVSLIKMACFVNVLWSCILDGSMWPITIFFMRKMFNFNKNI